MRYYAEFSSDGAEAACGDRAVIRLDGRESLASQCEVARREGASRKFTHWRLTSGASLLDARPQSMWQRVQS